VPPLRRARQRRQAARRRQVDRLSFGGNNGLTECLPIYSGGAGSAVGRPSEIVQRLRSADGGVGLLYQQGYFRQVLNPDGLAAGALSDQRLLHLAGAACAQAEGENLKVFVKLPTGSLADSSLEDEVGRVTLYCWTPNISGKRAAAGSGHHGFALRRRHPTTRIRQEDRAGIGGSAGAEDDGFCQAHGLSHERGTLAFLAPGRRAAVLIASIN